MNMASKTPWLVRIGLSLAFYTLPSCHRSLIAAIELQGQTTAEVVHTKPPGGSFWQLVELFLTLPRICAAR